MKSIKLALLLIFVLSAGLHAQCPPNGGNITITPVKSVYCKGETVNLTFNNAYPIMGTVTWGYTGTAGAANPVVPNKCKISGLQASGNVTLKATLNTPNGPCVYNLTFSITVSTLGADAGPDKLVGLPVLIGGTPVAIGGQAPFTYLWTPNTNIVAPYTATNANILVNPPSTTIYQVTVTDATGCTAVDAVTVYAASSVTSNNKHYAILKKKLDAGYYNTVLNAGNQTLYFMFDEEYYRPGTSNPITATILDNSNSSSYVLPTGLIKNIGDNRYALNVTAVGPPLSTNQFYKIIVRNEKNEVWQARFKVN